MEKNIQTFIRRIYRNKLRIKDHLLMALLTMAFICYVLFFNSAEKDVKLILLIASGFVIIVDLLMIVWHRYWIRRWREELTIITGVDYTRLDNENTENVNDLTFEIYENFLSTLQDVEKETIRRNQNRDAMNLIEKGLLVSLDAKFKLYLENKGIVCPLKLREINPATLPRTTKSKRRK